MKKFILSMSVLVSFGIYAISQNTGGNTVVFNTPTTVAINIDKPKNTPIDVANNPTNPVKPPVVTLPVVVTPQNPTPTPPPVVVPPRRTGIYNDGEYTGDSVDAYYGYVQVKAVISGGRLTDVVVLDYPQDRGTSVRINSRAMPILRQEALQAQSANIDAVSGASASSPAFIQSLESALSQAKV